VLAIHRAAGGSEPAGRAALGQIRAALSLPPPQARHAPDVHDLAAAYLCRLVRGRPLGPLSAKVAGLAAVYFLYLNGWDLTASPQELAGLVRRVVHSQASQGAAADFLRAGSQEAAGGQEA
jgi:prophage maintenance system killer protein